jgi:hypothetical protein
MHVVGPENNEPLRHNCRLWVNAGNSGRLSKVRVTLGLRAALDGESGNDLRFVIVEDLKVFFLQIADGTAMRIADQHRHQRHIHLALNREGAILSRDFLRLLCREGRTQEECQAGYDNSRPMSCVGIDETILLLAESLAGSDLRLMVWGCERDEMRSG